MRTSATGVAVAAAACLLVLVMVLAVMSPPKVPRNVVCPVPQTYALFTAEEAAKFLNEYPECSYLASPSPY
jgi:hypothetical protein